MEEDALLQEYLAGGDAKEYVVRLSSGTTRTHPRVSVRHHRAIEFTDEAFARPIIAYGSRNTRLVRLTNFLFYCPQGTQAFVCTEGDLNPTLGARLSEFAPDSLWGSASFVAKIVEYMSEDTRAGIRTVRLSGELLSQPLRHFLRTTLPEASIITTYGSSETGNIGTTLGCPHLAKEERTLYHPGEGVHIEIDAADEQGFGEIVVDKRVDGRELKAHRTGDVGRIHPGTCPCGNTVTFELAGRTAFDFIKIAGATVRQELCDAVLARYVHLVSDYRLFVSEHGTPLGMRGKLKLLVVPTAEGRNHPALATFLAEAVSEELLLTPTQTLAMLVGKDVFVPLSVECVDVLPVGHKAVRIERL